MCLYVTGLTSDEEDLVINVILASVRQAAEGPPLAGRSTGKKVCTTSMLKADQLLTRTVGIFV